MTDDTRTDDENSLQDNSLNTDRTSTVTEITEKDEKTDDRSSKKGRNFDTLTKELLDYIHLNPEDAIFKVIPEPLSSDEDRSSHSKTKKKELKLSLKPKEVKTHLDRFVVKQAEAKKSLAIAICDHFNQVKAQINNPDPKRPYYKQNILMMGPTGVGKTYLIKCLADLIGVPFVKSDATKFTETGYQGGDVEDLVRQLFHAADEDLELAEFGIIYLDEVDKIAIKNSPQNKDVSGRGVQSNLLKLMEETEVATKPPWDINAQIRGMMGGKKNDPQEKINTKYILFIVSGAFFGLDEIIEKRLKGSSYGFLSEKETKRETSDLLSHVSTKDLTSFGLEPEFVGRLPIRVACEELTADDLYQILIGCENSLIDQYKDNFRHYGIDAHFTDAALKEISIQAAAEETGARGLGTVLEKLFRNYKFELPSTEITEFLVTENTIKDPEQYLKELILKTGIDVMPASQQPDD